MKLLSKPSLWETVSLTTWQPHNLHIESLASTLVANVPISSLQVVSNSLIQITKAHMPQIRQALIVHHYINIPYTWNIHGKHIVFSLRYRDDLRSRLIISNDTIVFLKQHRVTLSEQLTNAEEIMCKAWYTLNSMQLLNSPIQRVHCHNGNSFHLYLLVITQSNLHLLRFIQLVEQFPFPGHMAWASSIHLPYEVCFSFGITTCHEEIVCFPFLSQKGDPLLWMLIFCLILHFDMLEPLAVEALYIVPVFVDFTLSFISSFPQENPFPQPLELL